MGPARFHCATLLFISRLGVFSIIKMLYTKTLQLCPLSEGQMAKQYLQKSAWNKKHFVSCEIRTHAHRSGLRPERSALDHSAKLTLVQMDNFRKPRCKLYTLNKVLWIQAYEFSLIYLKTPCDWINLCHSLVKIRYLNYIVSIFSHIVNTGPLAQLVRASC